MWTLLYTKIWKLLIIELARNLRIKTCKMCLQRRRSLRQSINHLAISVPRFNSVFDVNNKYILLEMIHLWVIQKSLSLKLSERNGRTILSRGERPATTISRQSHLGILVLRWFCVKKFPTLEDKTIFKKSGHVRA